MLYLFSWYKTATVAGWQGAGLDFRTLLREFIIDKCAQGNGLVYTEARLMVSLLFSHCFHSSLADVSFD